MRALQPQGFRGGDFSYKYYKYYRDAPHFLESGGMVKYPCKEKRGRFSYRQKFNLTRGIIMQTETVNNELKSYLRSYVENITEQSKGKNMYVCPLCGSGTGRNRTGAFSVMKDGLHWKCFACDNGGDIFDLVGLYENISEYREQLKFVGEMFDIPIDNHINQYQKPNKIEQNKHTYTDAHTHTYTDNVSSSKSDYTSFFIEANSNIHKTTYPAQRGLSNGVLSRFKIGYVEQWRNPKLPHDSIVPYSPRLIIPTSNHSYLARDTRLDENIPEYQQKYSKTKVGSIELFNSDIINRTTLPIFIVEGEIDAMSIIEVGGEAIALGSTSNTQKLIGILKNTQVSNSFILALDNDEAGRNATQKLSEELSKLGIQHVKFNPFGTYKDANEALVKDREQLEKAVLEANALSDNIENLEKEEYLKNATSNYIQSFINGIADSVNTPFISTGFKGLDALLDGGLYEGLYIVGAISSLGKTTLISQIADNIASRGQDVIIFSLEMARAEIMAKSISRLTLMDILNNGGDVSNAKTARGITTGSRYSNYSQTEQTIIQNAVTEYSEIAKHIFISEGIGDIGALDIRDTIEKHKTITGKSPVVIIDYLQILAPYNERATDKQNTDKAVLELKRISRDFKTPVIGISSFNRENYKTKVSMQSFKESGAIEYSSDVLIGLQLKGAGADKFDVDEAKSKNPREVELLILKNRNGKTGTQIDLAFYPMFNYFKEL